MRADASKGMGEMSSAETKAPEGAASPAVSTPPAEARSLEPEAQIPLTSEGFVTAFDQLRERAKAAGLHPVRVMFSDYAQRGMAILNGLLDALDGTPRKKP